MSLSTAGPSGRATRGESDLFGHPRGLTFLFATEMWERFSYYGMRALLVLYMVKYLLLPGHAENVIGLGALRHLLESMFGPLGAQPFSSHIYGLYTGLVYLTPIFGGILADRVLGQHRTILLGAALMAIGHFMMAFEPLFLFALTVLILGNGAFKPNMSAQVGGLYAPGDRRRDRAYSIFYVGINIGAFLAPLVCGTLGEEFGWHYGFTAAGVGMTIALAIYLYALPGLPPDELHKAAELGSEKKPLERSEWHGILALLALFLPTTLFWATYEQQGNTIALWADDYTDRDGRSRHLARRNPGHLVPGVQPVHDLCLHAVHRRAVGMAGEASRRAIERHQDVARLLRRRARQPDHGRRSLAVGRRAGRKLAVAARIFRRHHHRRALSLAHRVVAGVEGRSGTHGVDADGRVAGDELRRQFHRRLAWQLLEQHGQAEVLPDDRRRRAGCRPRHPRLRAPVAERDQGSDCKLAMSSPSRPAPRAFSHVETWVFDLDNTLYPHHLNLWQQVDERIRDYIARFLKITHEEAFHLQKDYYKRYGTSMRGLMTVHGMKPDDFLDFVHQIDHSPLTPNAALGSAIENLPGRKLILTNGTRRHADAVLARLALDNHFEDVFDIVAAELDPKPSPQTYDRFLKAHDVDAGRAAMFEDLARNLAVPHTLGMTTVLVVPEHTREVFREGWELEGRDAPHVDHVTDDLAGFLERIKAH